MLNKRADKLELLRIAEAVALEKSIDKELIISSMETGIAKAAKSKFGQDNEIKVVINRDNGDIEIFRKLIVTENPENTNTEIRLEDAITLNETNKDKVIGDEVLQVMDDLRAADVDFITIGQYLQPSTKHYPLNRYYTPKEFEDLGTIAKAKGFLLVSSSPLTRSSYHADEDFAKLQQNRLKNN